MYVPSPDQPEVEGIVFVNKKDEDYFIIPSLKEEEFEIRNETFSSTIKNIKTLNKEFVISINRFTDKLKKKFADQKISKMD